MSNVLWDNNSSIIVVAAERSLASVLRRLDEDNPYWVVVIRTPKWTPDVYHYAFRGSELRQLADESPERKAWSVEQAMDMHEWQSSGTSRGRRSRGAAAGHQGPAAGRVVDFDSTGRIVGIGQDVGNILLSGDSGDRSFGIVTDSLPSPNADEESLSTSPAWKRRRALEGFELGDLGPMRGGSSPGPGATPSAEIDVTLSAQTKAEIQVGATEVVDFRMELTSEAVPLAAARAARVKPDVPIMVSLSVENDAIEILKEREHTLAPPAAAQPSKGFFLVKGVRAGVSRLSVAFRQGGSELGVIGLAIEVVDAAARSGLAQSTANAAPREREDDDKLALLIEQRNEGGQVFYEYILHSEALGLPYRRLRSNPLLDRGGGLAASTIAFVDRIYERVTKELKSLDDLEQLQRETRALGANLCRELLDPNVAKVLWPLRSRIKLVQIVSWEPYIPWELVRLRDPDTGDIDDLFLAEYGLVRTLSDDMPPRALPMSVWRYLGAQFRLLPYPRVGAELDYFTGTSPNSLRARNILPSAIPATRDAFYDALADGDFDVLHISCHAESPHQSIERANLIIGDETPPGSGQPRLIDVDTITVAAEANLKRRRPLVFLNACETGRAGAVLTAWGGWPNVFLRAGAGAFVGSSWSVRDKPAAAFSTAFYNAMLDGKTLAEAASEARTSAKKLGDASWLAFKVYGHPRARRAV